MAKVQRHLSIHFNTRFFKGITHEEIFSGIEKKVELDNVYPLRTDPGITSPYFIICVAI
jgi:hypothetical protein